MMATGKADLTDFDSLEGSSLERLERDCRAGRLSLDAARMEHHKAEQSLRRADDNMRQAVIALARWAADLVGDDMELAEAFLWTFSQPGDGPLDQDARRSALVLTAERRSHGVGDQYLKEKART